MLTFENIIFDLGGVIIDIDVDRAIKAFSDYSSVSAPELFARATESKLFHQFEAGILGESEFRGKFRELLQTDLDDSTMDSCWLQLLLDMPIERLDALVELGKRYKLFILSNTNPIHMRRIHSMLGEALGISNFEPLFERVYYSYQMGLTKPDPRIFQVVLDQNNLDPKATLFVDDNQDNIDSARKLSLQVFKVDHPNDWVGFLSNDQP